MVFSLTHWNWQLDKRATCQSKTTHWYKIWNILIGNHTNSGKKFVLTSGMAFFIFTQDIKNGCGFVFLIKLIVTF